MAAYWLYGVMWKQSALLIFFSGYYLPIIHLSLNGDGQVDFQKIGRSIYVFRSLEYRTFIILHSYY